MYSQTNISTHWELNCPVQHESMKFNGHCFHKHYQKLNIIRRNFYLQESSWASSTLKSLVHSRMCERDAVFSLAVPFLLEVEAIGDLVMVNFWEFHMSYLMIAKIPSLCTQKQTVSEDSIYDHRYVGLLSWICQQKLQLFWNLMPSTSQHYPHCCKCFLVGAYWQEDLSGLLQVNSCMPHRQQCQEPWTAFLRTILSFHQDIIILSDNLDKVNFNF